MSPRFWTVALALAFSPAMAGAGVVYVDQTRRVDAETSHNDEPENADGESAADFGPFDGEAFSELHDEFDGDGATARTTQRSRLETSGVTAAGEFQVNALGEFGRGRSLLVAIFDVTESAQDFTFRYTLRGEGDATISLPAFHADVRFERLDTAGGGAFPVVDPFSGDFGNPEVQGSELVEFNESGTLAPGRYHLLFDMRALSVSWEDSYGGSYDVGLTLTDPGPGPTPIPLPPAAWAALASSGVLGGAGALRRRIQG